MAEAIANGEQAKTLKSSNPDDDHYQRLIDERKKLQLARQAYVPKGEMLDEWQRLLPTASTANPTASTAKPAASTVKRRASKVKPAARPKPIRPKPLIGRIGQSESHLKIAGTATLSPHQSKLLFPAGAQSTQTDRIIKPERENIGTLCETVLLVPADDKPMIPGFNFAMKPEPGNIESNALAHTEHVIAVLRASLSSLERENATLREVVLEKTTLVEELNAQIETLRQKERVHDDLEEKMDALQQDNIALRQEVQEKNVIVEKLTTSQDDFEKDPEKLKFYTGIASWEAFMDIYNTLSPSMSNTQKLSKFSRVLIFFFKLRLNLRDEDLAYRFNVAQATVSRIIRKISDIVVCHPELRSFCLKYAHRFDNQNVFQIIRYND